MMKAPWVSDSNAALLTDLYELTMLQSYFDQRMSEEAVFDLFMRRLPPSRNYLVACGLEHVLHYLETISFGDDAIEYLATLKRFSSQFLDGLRSFRFTGDVYAVPEGTYVFANEPLLEITAPLPQAQVVETFIMNQIQLATTAASKAARIVGVAGGRSVVDFGARRMHGADAALKLPRAFFIGGVDSTSSVVAGHTWGIPVSGTMAHSYVLAFENEIDAFRHFVRTYPAAILLVDTYDMKKGVENIIRLAGELGTAFQVSGVRLDSGDIAAHARQVRAQLDAAGLKQVKIFASSSLDEYEIQRLVSNGVPINGFGVGRHLASSSDVPVLDTAYKLAEYAGKAKMKMSESKTTLPGRKQVFRVKQDGTAVRDIIGLMDENGIPGEPLLVKVMENGRRLQPMERPEVARARCQGERTAFPDAFVGLGKIEPGYSVELSEGVQRLQREIVVRQRLDDPET